MATWQQGMGGIGHLNLGVSSMKDISLAILPLFGRIMRFDALLCGWQEEGQTNTL
jgi:hypothetical protein